MCESWYSQMNTSTSIPILEEEINWMGNLYIVIWRNETSCLQVSNLYYYSIRYILLMNNGHAVTCSPIPCKIRSLISKKTLGCYSSKSFKLQYRHFIMWGVLVSDGKCMPKNELYLDDVCNYSTCIHWENVLAAFNLPLLSIGLIKNHKI